MEINMKLGTKILLWVTAFFVLLGVVIYLMTFLPDEGDTSLDGNNTSESETEEMTEAPPIELALEADLAFVLSHDESYYSVTGLAVASGAYSVEIPAVHEGKPVAAIGENAFASDSLLGSVTIPESVKRIGDRAFAGCTSLYEINIPRELEYFGSGAIEGCDKLEFTEYENALYLGSDAAPYTLLISARSTDIESCTVHPDTRIICDFAFAECTELGKVILTDSLCQVGSDVFYDCYSLEFTKTDSACYLGSESNPYLLCLRGTDKRVSASYTLEEGTRIIAPMAFSNCSELKSVKLPNTVSFIGAYAFEKCEKLLNIELDSIPQWDILGFEASNALTIFNGNGDTMASLLTGEYLGCTWVRIN